MNNKPDKVNTGVGNNTINNNNESRREAYITSQKKRFMVKIANVKLSNQDKKELEDLVNDKTDLNKLKNRAIKLVDQRIKEKKTLTKQNLLTYLTPLKITQRNKNTFLTRFNNGENINTLKRNAKQREENVARIEINDIKSRLTTNLNVLNLNAQDRNVIMTKFDNGNRNVTKLVGEAKNLKSKRNAQKMTSERERLTTLSKQLGVEQTFMKAISKLNTTNSVKFLENRIRSAGSDDINERRREMKNYIEKNIFLERNKKIGFIRQVNLNATNLGELRTEVNSEINSAKKKKRMKNYDELDRYLKPLKVNRAKFLTRFKNTNISLENIKVSINKESSSINDLNKRKRALSNKVDEAKSLGVTLNFNTGVTTSEDVNRINKKVDNAIEREVNGGRKVLSNKVIDADLEQNFMNQITNVKNVKTLKNLEKRINTAISFKTGVKTKAVTKYMKNLGLTDTDIQNVVSKNLSLNVSRKLADEIKNNRIESQVIQILDDKGVPSMYRKQFKNKIGKSSITSIAKEIESFMKEKTRNSVNTIEEILNKYDIKPNQRQAILNNWKTYPNMTINNVKNRVSKITEATKRRRGNELRAYLTSNLQMSANDIEKIMTNFNVNFQDINNLKEKAKKLKQLSNEKMRITQRILKARSDGVNINNTNVKNMNNVSNINKRINQAYIIKGKKNISQRALNRNINVSNDLNAIESMNNVQRLKNKLNGIISNKKKSDLSKLVKVLQNLNQENKNRFLQKFKNQNNSLGSLLNNVQKAKESSAKNKIEKTKKELYTYINQTLNLNVKDRESIMSNFNKTPNLYKMKRKANDLKRMRVSEKITSNRKKLEKTLESINLNNRNKKSILTKFNRNPGNVEIFEANAKTLAETKKKAKQKPVINYINSKNIGKYGEKLIKNFSEGLLTTEKVKNEADKKRESLNAEIITAGKQKLRSFMNKTLLTNENKSKFINRVQLNTNITLLQNEIKQIDGAIRSKRNALAKKRTELKIYLDSLTRLTTNERSKIMNSSDNVESLKKRAKQINDGRQEKEKLAKEKKVRNNFNAGTALESLNINRDIRKMLNTSSLSKTQKAKYLKQINKPGANLKPLRNLLVRNIDLEKRRGEVVDKTKKYFKITYGATRWKDLLESAKTLEQLNAIDKNLSSKVELRNEIAISKIANRRELLGVVMKSDSNVESLRRKFEKGLNNIETEKISKVTGPLIGGILSKVANANRIEAKQEIRAFKGAGAKNQNKFIRRLDAGEPVSKVLKEARLRNQNGMKKMSKTKKALMAAPPPLSKVNIAPSPPKVNVTPSPPKVNQIAEAKKEIRAFKGAGAKNQNKFIRRLDAGEPVNKVLKEARLRNQNGMKKMSKTKKALMKMSKII